MNSEERHSLTGHLQDLPYSDRQILVVADDSLVEAERKAAQRATTEKRPVSWVDIAQTVLVHSVSGNVTETAVEVTKEAVQAWNRFRESGMKVLTVSRSEARALLFPPGHPRDGVLYVGHPANPPIYYTTAQFHRMTFEHKFAEAIRLLMALGAVEISVEHVSGWSADFSAKMSVPLLTGLAEVQATAGREVKNSSQLLFTAKLKNQAVPKVPEGLVWFNHEPTWREIATGRLEFGLADFSLSVRYEDDFGVNAGLKLAATKAGLDLGGKFEDHQATVWRIAGKFSEGRAPNPGLPADG